MEQFMLTFIMIIYSVYTFLKIYISVMQIGYINLEKIAKPVLMGAGRYMVAGNYAVAKEKLSLIGHFVDYLLFVWWVIGGFAWLQKLVGIEDTTFNAVLFLFGFIAINYIVTLPLGIYEKFKIDEAFGFNKMTPRDFIVDQLKQAVLFALIAGAALWALSWIIIYVPNWWIWGFLFMFALALGANLLMPFFMGLFYKFSPIEEGELKSSIESMMSQAGLHSDGIFSMNASKKSGKLNAFFAGLGKSKRVVLFDTLLEKLNNKELLAVLGHELGHFKHGDIWKNIAIVGLLMFIAFFVFGHIPDSVYSGMGVVPTAGVKIALLFLLFPVLGFLFTPVMSFISQHNEYAADEYGSMVGGEKHLISALLKLVTENKSFPKSHPLVIFFYHTHPPVIERLKALGFDASQVDLDAPLPSGGIFEFIDKWDADSGV
jgi:STE24 endopeptidase